MVMYGGSGNVTARWNTQLFQDFISYFSLALLSRRRGVAYCVWRRMCGPNVP